MRQKLVILLVLICLITSTASADDMIVQTGEIQPTPQPQQQQPQYPTAEIEQLDVSIRHVSDDIIYSWMSEWEIGLVSSRIQFITALWKLNGRKTGTIVLGTQEEAEQESAVLWAQQNGIPTDGELTQAEADYILWILSGTPISNNRHDMSEGNPEWVLWACDAGIHIAEEQKATNLDVFDERCLYYFYHRRVERAFPITVHEFLQSCQNVVDTARTHHYRYGNSKAEDPTTDGIISCDRMIAKALYDLGYTDQPRGGITCGNADRYLANWGFKRSESLSDAKKGSIMLVKHAGKEKTSHMFVFASDFDMKTMTGDRYDCGEQENIDAVQPLRKGFWYRTDSVIVYNIPY